MRFSLQLFRSFAAVTMTSLCGFSVSCLPLEGRPCAGDADCVEGWRCAAQVCERVDDVETCSNRDDCAPGTDCVNEICEADTDGGVPLDGGATPDDGGQDGLAVSVRDFELTEVENGGLFVNNEFGSTAVTSGADATLKVVATISVPESLSARAHEIRVEVSDTGASADVYIVVPEDAGFIDITVDLVIEIPSTWDLDVSSTTNTVVDGILGELDFHTVGDVTVSNSAGDIDVFSTEGNVDVQTVLNENVFISADIGDIVVRLPLNASFEITGYYLEAAGSDLGPFTLFGTDLFGSIDGSVGNVLVAEEHDVYLSAQAGSITLSGF